MLAEISHWVFEPLNSLYPDSLTAARIQFASGTPFSTPSAGVGVAPDSDRTADIALWSFSAQFRKSLRLGSFLDNSVGKHGRGGGAVAGLVRGHFLQFWVL